MYGHLAPTTGGFIGGMCVGNVSPGGEPVNLNAKVTGYLPKIKEMAENMVLLNMLVFWLLK